MNEIVKRENGVWSAAQPDKKGVSQKNTPAIENTNNGGNENE